MNMNLVTLGYWFSARPGSLASGAIKIFVVFILALVVLGIYSYLRTKRKNELYRKIWGKLIGFSITNICIGLLILFLFYENVPYLSARIFGLIWLLYMMIAVYFIFRKVKEIPLIKEKRKQEEEYKKYLP